PPRLYTLSLHDALPIWPVDPRPQFRHEAKIRVLSVVHLSAAVAVRRRRAFGHHVRAEQISQGKIFARSTPFVAKAAFPRGNQPADRKSTRLNSSHVEIS